VCCSCFRYIVPKFILLREVQAGIEGSGGHGEKEGIKTRRDDTDDSNERDDIKESEI
jgi:hypothetical protein